MDGKQLVTYGLIGGAAYLAYKAFAGSQTVTVTARPGAAPAPRAGAPATQPTIPTSITTPTVTPGASWTLPQAPAGVIPGAAPRLSADSLSAAASAQGILGKLTPDQWNWLVMNSLRMQSFNLDALFGYTSDPARTATYSAQDFFDIATGARSAPAPVAQPVTQTCPPDCGSDPVTALTQVIQAAAGAGVSNLRPDEWNYYVGAYYDMDRFFGPVGQYWRDTTYSAKMFAQVVTGQVATGYQPSDVSGMSGLGIPTARGIFTNHPILRPNIPGSRRWIPIPQREVAVGERGRAGRVWADTRGGWAV